MTEVTRIERITQPLPASVSASAARAAGLPTHVLPPGHDGRRQAEFTETPWTVIAEDEELVLRGVAVNMAPRGGGGGYDVLVVKDKQSGQVSITTVPRIA